MQARHDLTVAVPVVGHLHGPDLVAVGIDDEVDLAPHSALVGAVLPDLPLTLAQHFEPCAVDNEVQRPAPRAVGDRDRQVLLPP